jgi:hypothetical protein
VASVSRSRLSELEVVRRSIRITAWSVIVKMLISFRNNGYYSKGATFTTTAKIVSRTIVFTSTR